MKTLGERYKELREAKGLSNYRIWKLTGITQPNLSQLESGIYKPSDEVLAKLASVEALGVSLPLLQGWKAIESKPETIKRYLENPLSLPAFVEVFHLIKTAIGREPTLLEMADIIEAAPISIEPLYMEYSNIALGGKVVNSGPIEMKASKQLSREEIFSLLDQLPIEALEAALKKRFGQDFKLVKVDQPHSTEQP